VPFDERPLPPVEERLTLEEAGQLLDPPRSKKAMEQGRHRRSFPVAVDAENGRVYTTREWLREYASTARSRVHVRDEPAPTEPEKPAAWVAPARAADDPLMEMVEQLIQENAALRLEIARLRSRR
jgi:hypothetical protein